MSIYAVILHLTGAIALLLWAVRMVRTGVERAHEPRLRRILAGSQRSSVKAAGIGAVVAIVLQSSTAVALLAAGFAGRGVLTLATGLAIMLGADFGSAVVVQILAIKLDWLVPILLIVGVFCFFRGTRRETRQLGRILVGIALILVSLGLIGDATAPLREAEVLPLVVAYLRHDFLTAFLLGTAFTWLVHSSIASILLIVSFAAQGLVPLELGVSLMLGANLGGALIAIGLTRQGSAAARRIAAGNVLFRGAGAVVTLPALQLFGPELSLLDPDFSRHIATAHLAFNAALLIVCLPLIGPVARLLERTIRETSGPEEENALDLSPSCLDQSVLPSPNLALASATRELLRMAEIVERMLSPMMDIYETADPVKIRQAKLLEDAVNQAQREIKLYLARIKYADDEQALRGQQLSNFAINLEHVGDAITKTMLKLAKNRHEQGLAFSAEGWGELTDLHHRVMTNMHLALNVLVSKDRDSARQLLNEKDAMRAAERASFGEHINRLRSGKVASIETSDIHLETVRALKTINSLLASVAYPILSESGELLDSRLTVRAQN
ncbi:Na/Pi cotransporter family protein [Consotaella aegiceratis]|uniref:Na/Pi cotransporter family protein n=1 Tax=Consotaella aegiceratis TaxID=3097961 RepID=UPI002F42163E